MRPLNLFQALLFVENEALPLLENGIFVQISM